MKKTRYFYCGEDMYDCVFTLEQLARQFDELKANGDTEDESFSDWLNNATDKNGALDEITDRTLDKFPSKRNGLPIVAIDWKTGKPDYIFPEMKDRYMVIDRYEDYIYDSDGEIIADAVYVVKKQ